MFDVFCILFHLPNLVGIFTIIFSSEYLQRLKISLLIKGVNNQVTPFDGIIHEQRAWFGLIHLVFPLTNKELVDKIEMERKKLILAAPKDGIKKRITKLSFEERMQYSKSEAATKLFSIMIEKRTNLCVAADVTQIDDLLVMADKLGPFICIFKIYSDIIEGCTENDKEELKQLAVRHNFLIMDDRQLTKSGNIVRKQFNQLSKWATLVTAHLSSGSGVLEGIKNGESYDSTNVGIFLTCSENNFINPGYKQKAAELAEKYPEMVVGLESETGEASTNPGLIQLTPVDHLDEGPEYLSLQKTVLENGADIVVAGHGIISSPIPVETAKSYKKLLWKTYLSIVGQ